VTILVINNYTDERDLPRAEKIRDILRKERREAILWHFSEVGMRGISREVDAIVLSGSRAHLRDEDVCSKCSAEVDLVMRSNVPILGICFGHQLIGKAFGSEIGSLPTFLDRPEDIQVLEPNEILKSWEIGDKLRVCQSHQDFVDDVPLDFIRLAESKSCKVEAMKHKTRPIYGIQAHVERTAEGASDGRQIIRNFLENVVEG